MEKPLIKYNFIDGYLCKELIEAFKSISTSFKTENNSLIRRMPNRIELNSLIFKSTGNVSLHRAVSDIRQKIIVEVGNYYNDINIFPEYTILTNSLMGDQFQLHADAEKKENGVWIPNHTPQRAYTGMLYLNNGGGVDFVGGEIIFPELDVNITPTEGMLVGFKTSRDYTHRVPRIIAGSRFTLSLWMTKNTAMRER